MRRGGKRPKPLEIKPFITITNFTQQVNLYSLYQLIQENLLGPRNSLNPIPNFPSHSNKSMLGE
ncbi:MAG: hypothetical protein RIQ70_1048 [Bacteroidota bacterium]|jgi:hypothetical protein